jgi:hypothetical protein
MKDQNGQSKCFGFVTFTDSNIVDEFMKQRPHVLDGRQIDPKRASTGIHLSFRFKYLYYHF